MTGPRFQLGQAFETHDFCGPGPAVTARDFSWAGPYSPARPGPKIYNPGDEESQIQKISNLINTVHLKL